MKTFMLRFRTVLLLFLFSMIFVGANSQSSYLLVRGILKDSKTGEAIRFAAITVPGTDIGTVSNSDGEFTLKISNVLKAEYFEVSHISYATSRFKISEATGEVRTYLIELQPVQLKEVPVIDADARKIVEMAFRNIRQNYSTEPNMMTGFYREYIMQRRDYLSISEAVVDIYNAPYQGFQNDQVKIFKGRKSSDVKNADTLMVRLQGGPYVLLLLDIVKNTDLSIGLDDLDNYKYEISRYVQIDDKLHWVVDFVPAVNRENALYKGKLYISQENYAISRAEFSLDLSDEEKAASSFIKKKPSGMVFAPVSTGYIVTFKEQEGRYYLNYVRVDLKFRCDWKKKLFRNTYTLMSEMAITGRNSGNIVKFENEDQFRSSMIFSEKVTDFSDPDFWGEHNIIEPEQSIENAIRKLMK